MPLRSLLLALLWLCAFAAGAAPRIGVATMAPGEIFFERFGHNAIVVADPASGQATSYNFGFFDPEEPDFVGRFARGQMMYYLVALPLEQDLAHYRDTGRGVTLQWLDLAPQQAQALADALAERARPENARYRYDYFTDNCSTQVRDALDAALGGALRSQLAGRSRGNTFRSEAVRLASPALWMWLGFDIGLGPYADHPMSRWEEAYVPMRLADSLAEVRNSAGRPLVQSQVELLPHRAAPEPPEAPRRWLPWLIAGVLVAVAVAALGRHHPRAIAALALPLWLLCGIAGALLAYLWGFTEHQAAWANRNLLLFNPLCLLLIPGAIAVLRRGMLPRWNGWLLGLIAAGAMAAWILHWLPLRPQYNQTWVALLLPIHLALAYVFMPRRLSHRKR
ncbi:DUF4105 domain-containing protein [Pseudoxanthomonas wuyuanensis]|uniref:Uncharacterized protein n=1 Tax=Pseudoxanthomonas wuyuanensis TaxID=1073196 RepID=A0A286DD34_9GAMM|nr:DUF4105 domain-containing protein [Pseudoxanthomonas wuyuanensis]KAF1720740.1 DUF4105 domain-containing protein [Pseudoxanthomonas wuyuanensis]SOD56529.1 protein of unknown function [Pseudoxanthomonas wuyuanensis]